MTGIEVRLYDLGAHAYAWATAQAGWQASCAALATRLSSDTTHLLDLGCGPGGVLAAAAAVVQPGALLVGLDLAARMLAAARRTPGARRAALVRADALALPFPAGVFDAVTGHSFLYLTAPRERVLGEAWRVLRPGGRLLLVEPWAGRVEPRAVWRHSRDPRFVLSVTLWRAFNRLRGRFRAAELAALLRASGFEAPRGAVVLGGLGLLVQADKPPRERG